MLDDILVVGVWTRNAVGGDDKYIEQAFQYFMDNFALLKSSKTLIAGDFNSNAIWDKKHRKKCHTNMVKMLDDLSIISAYHTIHNQKHGSETTHTFYQYRHSDKPYHIDYCFLSKTWQLLNAEIGSASKWLNLSDHLPLVTSLGLISDRV